MPVVSPLSNARIARAIQGCLSAVGLMAVPLPAFAQLACPPNCVQLAAQPSSPAETIREDEKRRLAPPTSAPPSVDVERKRAVKPPAGIKVDVKGFRFTGLTVVPEQRLQGIVAKFVGPGKTFEDLQSAADAA